MRSFTMIDFLASDKAVATMIAGAALAAPAAAAAATSVPAVAPAAATAVAPGHDVPHPISEYGYRIRLRHPAA